MMRRLLPFVLSLAAPLAAQMLPVTGHVQDGAVAVVAGIISFTPTLCNGQPTAFQLAGVGEFSAIPFVAPIKDGLFSLALPNVAASTPHICLSAVAVNTQTGATLLRTGYATMQPMPGASWCPSVNGAPACNFDLYLPTTVVQPQPGPPGASVAGPPGPQGALGPQGPQGMSGPAGPQGLTGAIGATGALGPIGPKGDQGVAGIAGATGSKGDLGATGAQGLQGVPGPLGPIGPQGTAGVTGPIGPAGQNGTPGATGLPGQKGDQGFIGPIGPQGVTGAAGSAGAAGSQGIPGPTGASGAIGPGGPIGPQGANGLPGAVGPAGQNGTAGAPGQQGIPGVAGSTGATGPIGPAGVTGANGTPGQQGVPGVAGSTGPIGPSGPIGPQGPLGDGSLSAATANTAPNGQPANGVSAAALSAPCTGQPCTISIPATYPINAERSPNPDLSLFLPGPQQHAIDRRGGAEVHTFNDPAAQGAFLGATGLGINYLSHTQTYDGDALLIDQQIGSPGYDRGNVKGTGVAQGWLTAHAIRIKLRAYGAGITGGLDIDAQKYGIGDFHNYFYVHGAGGFRAASDEMTQGLAVAAGELSGPGTGGNIFTGTVTAKSGFRITTNPVTGSGTQGVGRFLIDTSTPLYTGFITSLAPMPGMPATLATLNGATLPVSHAWGTLASCASTPPLIQSNNGNTIATPTSCVLTILGGASQSTGLVAGDLVPFAGRFHETASVLSSSAPSGGSQTVTFAFIQDHQPGEAWMQSAYGAGGFEVVANDANGLRYTLDVLGSPAANQVAVTQFAGASSQAWGVYGRLNMSQWGFAGAPTSDGTNVTLPFYPQSVDGNRAIESYPVVTISGTGTVFDGPCLNTHRTQQSFPALIQCTKNVPAGTVSPNNTGFVTLGTTGYGNSQAVLYATAQVLDVQNYAGYTPLVDGTLWLESNAIPLNLGDTVEEPHDYAAGYVAKATGLGFENIYADQYSSIEDPGAGGYGIDAQIYARNTKFTNPCNYYAGCGGTMSTPHGYFVSGMASGLGGMSNAPFPAGSSFLSAGCDPKTGDCSDPLYHYYVLNQQGWQPPSGPRRDFNVDFNPYTGVVTFNAWYAQFPNLGIDGAQINTGTLNAARLPVSYTAPLAAALAATPTVCPAGQAATGVDAHGNALGCAAGSGGAAAPTVAANILVIARPDGTFAPAGLQDVYNLLATDDTPSVALFREGIRTKVGTGNSTPQTGQAQIELYKDANGHAILNSGMAQLCVKTSDGNCAVVGQTTFPAIRSLLAGLPNCSYSGADWSQVWRDGSCVLPPGLPASWAGAAYFNVGPDTTGTLSGSTGTIAYTVLHAGDAVIVTTQTKLNSSGVPTSVTSSNGQTGTLIGSSFDTGSNGFRVSSFVLTNLTAGAQNFIVNYTSSNVSTVGYVEIEADEFQNVPATGTVFESVASTVTGNACGTVTTTGANETVIAWVDDGTHRPSNNGAWVDSSGLTYLSPANSLLFGHTLAVASSITPTFQRAPLNCLAFALKHN